MRTLPTDLAPHFSRQLHHPVQQQDERCAVLNAAAQHLLLDRVCSRMTMRLGKHAAGGI
jgi:hypothetical protein